MQFKTLKIYNLNQKIRAHYRRLRGKPEMRANYIVACPSCFHDQGLKLLAEKTAFQMAGACPNCKTRSPKKIRLSELQWIAHTFFVWGTFQRAEYGGYPAVVFNERQTTSISFSDWLSLDVKLIEQILGVGFFLYGPRFWMFGEVEPLKGLQDKNIRTTVIQRVVSEYPTKTIDQDTLLYRVRKDVKNPDTASEYDSPPLGLEGTGRLDSSGFPVLYASSDLEVCVHECRVAAEDEIFVATLKPTRKLKLLDLSGVLAEENVTEFESLDIAIHMLFLAEKHSYEISREISLASKRAGYDGIIYPSYFSLLRTSAMPFMTTYGISHRRVPEMRESENRKMIPNVAIFGRPIEKGDLAVACINRLMINAVEYSLHFGPVKF